MHILLPPSEGKSPAGKGKWAPGGGKFGRQLREERLIVAAELANATPTQLKIPPSLQSSAQLANGRLLSGSPCLPAWRRYSGVVFNGLDATGLNGEEKVAADSRIVVVSGLLGLVGFDDAIPDYRAPIDARTPALGNLASWWRPHLTRVIHQLDGDIIDLLPQSHRHALVVPADRGWTVDFLHGTTRGGHDAKFAKGRFARWLLTNDIRSWKKWREDGWSVEVIPPTSN